MYWSVNCKSLKSLGGSEKLRIAEIIAGVAMNEKTIDLRSDTLTKPTASMRQAMALAEVGDDCFMEDPTVQQLQERAATLFRREASLFVPSGTMANLICLLVHTQPGQEVICDKLSHVYNFEMGSMSSIAGVLPRILESEEGILDWQQIAEAIRPRRYYRSHTGLIVLENTHMMSGGLVYPTEAALHVCRMARDAGIPIHLDGARIFNAATYLAQDVAAMTKDFDSVQFCLSKGLGAPAGSMIVGTAGFISQCREMRKLLGGGMRQIGILAAAGIVALDVGPGRLVMDHANAKLLANEIVGSQAIEVNPGRVQTNIVVFRVPVQTSQDFLGAIRRRNILALPIDEKHVRMVTHFGVSSEDIEDAAHRIRQTVMGN